MYVCMYVCMYVFIYARHLNIHDARGIEARTDDLYGMYVCMPIYMYVYIHMRDISRLMMLAALKHALMIYMECMYVCLYICMYTYTCATLRDL